VWAILDRCPIEYESLFTELWSGDELTLMRQPGIGNQGTFAKQLHILANQDIAPYIYFAEDDYFYTPSSLHTLISVLRHNPDATFATPYHHPDYDQANLHPQAERNRWTNGSQAWVSEMSTTCTFMTTATTLRQTVGHFQLYGHRLARPAGDLAMWMTLTKRQMFNPAFFLSHLLHRRWFWAWSWLSAWLMGSRLLLTRPRYTLWAPAVSLATHMNARQIDWQVNWKPLWNAGKQQL
jgi:hypothetical protein